MEADRGLILVENNSNPFIVDESGHLIIFYRFVLRNLYEALIQTAEINDSLWRGRRRPYDFTTKMFGGETYERLFFLGLNLRPILFLKKSTNSSSSCLIHKIQIKL